MKVGKYNIPNLRFTSTLVDATSKIFDKWESLEAPNQLAVAQLIGYKGVSGAFLTKLACLRDYGLIEKRGLKVTELGKKLTFGRSEEKVQAQNEAILNIPLWKEFYNKWKKNPPEADFWANLMTIAEIQAPEAHKIADEVRSEYVKDILQISESAGGPSPPPPSPPPEPPVSPPTGVKILPVGVSSGTKELVVNINIQITLPETRDGDVYDKIFESLSKHFFKN